MRRQPIQINLTIDFIIRTSNDPPTTAGEPFNQELRQRIHQQMTILLDQMKDLKQENTELRIEIEKQRRGFKMRLEDQVDMTLEAFAKKYHSCEAKPQRNKVYNALNDFIKTIAGNHAEQTKELYNKFEHYLSEARKSDYKQE